MVKIKRKRKPMTPEQKAAAIERLAKAREAKGPVQYQNIHPDVVAKPDDHFLSLKKVRSWMKSTKEQISSLRGEVRRDVKGAKAKLWDIDGYIRHMQYYLKHGDWVDNRYGEYQEKKVKWRTIATSQM